MKIHKSMYDDTEYGPESNLKFEKTLTQQQFKDEQNVNNIVKKYGVAAFTDQTQYLSQQFADIANLNDFHAAQNLILSIEDSFMSLPAEVRKEFHNDPAALVSFVADKNNLQKAIDLGLVKKPEQKIPVKESAQAPQAVTEQK